MLAAIGLALGAFFLWLVLREVRVAEVAASLRGIRPSLVPAFVVLVAVFYVLKALRWSLLLSPLRSVPGLRLLPAVMIGYTASAILPLQLGELVRAHLAATHERLPGASVLATIGLERIFELLTLMLVIAAGMLLGERLSPDLVTAGLYLGAVAGAALAVAVAFALATERVVAFVSVVAAVLPDGWQRSVVGHARRFGEGLHAVRRPALLVRIIGNSLAQWACMWGCMYLSLAAVGIEATLPIAVVVLVFTVISLTLPTSPGNVGSIQAAYYLALKPFGVSASMAFSASLFFHVLSYVVVFSLGAYWLYVGSYGSGGLREVLRRARRDSG